VKQVSLRRGAIQKRKKSVPIQKKDGLGTKRARGRGGSRKKRGPGGEKSKKNRPEAVSTKKKSESPCCQQSTVKKIANEIATKKERQEGIIPIRTDARNIGHLIPGRDTGFSRSKKRFLSAGVKKVDLSRQGDDSLTKEH